ncbi:MAG: toprim domain-containing protein, partial [Nitrospirae bacterium]
EEIILSGLCKKTDGEVIDTFRDRLMFPLFSSRGEPIAFGGRIISPESQAPKYLNSPQTILFNKSREVFGLYQAKREISSKDYVILTEGYLDVITTYQQGFKNVIAPLGTALTEAQLRRLSHLTKKVLIVFDSDEAGLKATKRAFSLIYANNMTARALLLPPGEDPDTFLRKRGAEAFRSQFKKVKGIVEFYLSLKGERVEKIKELLAVIKTISDPIIKAELLRELSEKTGISEQYLIEEIGRERKGPKERPTLSKKPVGLPKPEELLIALCIDHPEQLKIVKDSLNPDIIDNPMLRDILKRLLLAEGSTIREHLTEEELSHFSSVSLRFDVDEEAVEKNIIDCVKKIKGKNIRKRLKEIEMEIRMAEKEGDENLLSDLQKRLQETLKEGVNEGLL